MRSLKTKPLGEIAPLVQGHALHAPAKLYGGTLEWVHARSGDAATMAGYMGDSAMFETALGNSAMGYAGATKGDWGRLVRG